MPLHWIYSPDKIQSLLGGEPPEFFKTPSSPFYKYPVGELSPYGTEVFYTLSSLVEHGGVQVCTSPGVHVATVATQFRRRAQSTTTAVQHAIGRRRRP